MPAQATLAALAALAETIGSMKDALNRVPGGGEPRAERRWKGQSGAVHSLLEDPTMPPPTCPLEYVIEKANPYTVGAAPTYEDPIVVEVQKDVGNWYFKGVGHHVEKAIRIPYTYTKNNVVIRDYLLIGYEGGGAY